MLCRISPLKGFKVVADASRHSFTFPSRGAVYLPWSWIWALSNKCARSDGFKRNLKRTAAPTSRLTSRLLEPQAPSKKSYSIEETTCQRARKAAHKEIWGTNARPQSGVPATPGHSSHPRGPEDSVLEVLCPAYITWSRDNPIRSPGRGSQNCISKWNAVSFLYVFLSLHNSRRLKERFEQRVWRPLLWVESMILQRSPKAGETGKRVTRARTLEPFGVESWHNSASSFLNADNNTRLGGLMWDLKSDTLRSWHIIRAQWIIIIVWSSRPFQREGLRRFLGLESLLGGARVWSLPEPTVQAAVRGRVLPKPTIQFP